MGDVRDFPKFREGVVAGFVKTRKNLRDGTITVRVVNERFVLSLKNKFARMFMKETTKRAIVHFARESGKRNPSITGLVVNPTGKEVLRHTRLEVA